MTRSRHAPTRSAAGRSRLLALLIPLVAVAIAGVVYLTGRGDERALTPVEREAVAWIKQHLGEGSVILVPAAPRELERSLREQGFGGPAFARVYRVPSAVSDPAIRDGALQGDWRRVDYLLLTPDERQRLLADGGSLAAVALAGAHLVRQWEPDPGNPDDRAADPLSLWKAARPSDTERRYLLDSQAYIQARFEQDGAYANANGSVTSENQAYAMLRAVWLNDRASFDRAWDWTKQHLRRDDGLLSWLWVDGAVADPHTAPDADVDAALALLLGSRVWNDDELRAEGVRLVEAIWEHQVTEVDGRPYLAAGEWATEGRVVGLNPSYFAPYAFRIFQEVDPEHDWLALVDSSYRVLFAMSKETLGFEESSGLPPDWVGLNRETGEFVPYEIAGRVTTRYGYDAARTYWRVALDERWSDDGRPGAYLRQAGFLRDEVARKGYVSAVYERDGTIVEAPPSLVGLAGAIAALLSLEPRLAHDLYAREIIGGATRGPDGISWRNPDDLYTQEWGWFTVALYAGALPDLWRHPDARFIR